MLSTPPRDTRDLDKLTKYTESLNALRRRVAVEQARVKGSHLAPGTVSQQPVLEAIANRHERLGIDPSPFRGGGTLADDDGGLEHAVRRFSNFNEELSTVLALASPGRSTDGPAVPLSTQLASAATTTKFADLLAETEHLSDVVASLRSEAAAKEVAWQQRFQALKLDIAERDKKIDQHRSAEEKLSLLVDQLKSRVDSDARHSSNNNVESTLRETIRDLEKRYKTLEDDAIQREELLRFQEGEIRRLETLVTATSAAVAETERRAATASEASAQRIVELEDERLMLLSQKRDADLALAAARTSLTALSVSLTSPTRDRSSPRGEAEEGEDATDTSIATVVVKLHAELEAVRQRCAHLQAEYLKAQHQNTQLKSRCEGLAQRVVEMESLRAEVDAKAMDASTEVSRLQITLSAEETKRHQLKKAMEKVQAQIEAVLAEKAQLSREHEDELRLKQLRITHLEGSVMDAERRLTEAEDAHREREERSKARSADLEAVLLQTEAEIERLVSENAQARDHVAEADQRLTEALDRCSNAEARWTSVEHQVRLAAATHAQSVTEHKRELSALRSELASANERCEAALRDAQTARKQRDIATERNTLLQSSLQKELDNATASAKTQMKQLAAMLSKREDEVSRLRERVAVLEAAQAANALALEQHQATLDAVYSTQSGRRPTRS